MLAMHGNTSGPVVPVEGEDPDKLLDEAIAVDQMAFDVANGKGPLTALHVCRGNNQSMWYAQGGYGPLAEKVFNGLKVDRWLLEYDTERGFPTSISIDYMQEAADEELTYEAGDFEPL